MIMCVNPFPLCKHYGFSAHMLYSWPSISAIYWKLVFSASHFDGGS